MKAAYIHQASIKISVGLWGIEDQHLSSIIQKQQIFWLGNHFEADIRQNFTDTLTQALEQGYTKEMLTETLKQQFSDIAENHKLTGRAWQNTQP